MKRCYVVILNYKRWEDTVECLKALFNSTYNNFKAIVVDNCSGNQSLENIVASFAGNPLKKRGTGQEIMGQQLSKAGLSNMRVVDFPDLLLVQNDSNAGFAAGNNVILNRLTGEDAYVWLLNPDMIAKEDALEELIKAADQRENTIIGAVTKSFYDPGEILFYGGGKVNYFSATVMLIKRPEYLHKLEYISGGSLLMPAHLLKTVGLLPEQYFLYWEETDWCHEATARGCQLHVCEQAICYDKISTTIGRGFLSDYFYTRNGLMFLGKYNKGYIPGAVIMTLFRAAKRLGVGQMARAKGVIRGVFDFLTNRQYGNQ